MYNVPVIDIRALHSDGTRRQMDAACRDWGFFQIINHGIEASLIENIQSAMRAFFHRSSAEKRMISRTADNAWGFYDQELTRNTRDWKEIYDYGPEDGGLLSPQWPESVPGFRQATLAFYGACEQLARQLLEVISLNLGMPAAWLNSSFGANHSSFLRLNYYPNCPVASDGYLGVNHHTDAGALTLLLQDDQPGLEVFRDGAWHLVVPRADALVVNIGDIVQVWSNDRYRAALHRVLVNPERERFSAPFFFNPAYEACYQPLPSVVTVNDPARYKAINWGEFRSHRAAGDYADLGEEVQISHYRTARM